MLPCYIIGLRVLFHSGSTKSACIHYKTERYIIEELIKRGFHKFERGDVLMKKTVEIGKDYFRGMAEYVTGKDVLPVIISIRNGGIRTKILKRATNLQIPIIRFEKNNNPNIRVLLSSAFKEMVEYKIDMKMPWRVQKPKNQKYKFSAIGKQDQEIEYLSEVKNEVEDLISYLLIAVYNEDGSSDRKESKEYHSALSMHLLKKGKWKFNEWKIKTPLSQRSLEDIFEEAITADFMKKIWKSLSSMGFKSPQYKDATEKGLNTKGCSIEFINWDSECYSLIFFAMLKRHYWTGALQLIDTGFIKIRHILLGCVLLDDEANSWKTTPQLKEKLQSAKNAFTERAIRITGCIDDTDQNNAVRTETEDNETFEKELGGCVKHTGRLLLNHGYLRDAIGTQNKKYLEKDTIKNVLNKMWFGTAQFNSEMTLRCIILALVHPFVLPLLMITMETSPLLWFNRKYKLPFMKVFLHMLGFLFLLIAYSYMLLFDYRDNGISYSDYFIIVWMVSFFVDETKQVFVAFIRRNGKSYAQYKWNFVDWLLIILYTSGMLLKAVKGSSSQMASKVLLVAALMAICTRILNLCFMTEFLGPKLVIIQRMVKDTVAFMIIMTVILIWYSVSFYAFSYPNTDFSWKQIEKIISNGYWTLFGELNLDDDTLTIPACTFNRTLYESGVLHRCPTQLAVYLTPYLKALYVLIAVVLLLNLLIAMYSHSFNEVQQQSDFYWRKIQTDFLEEYSIKTIFPVHLQLLALPGIVFAMMWVIYRKCRSVVPKEEKEKKGSVVLKDNPESGPMSVVKVFLYDTSYDLTLTSTIKAEKYAAVIGKGQIRLEDFKAITGELETDSTRRGMRSDMVDNKNLELMNRLQNIEEKLNMLLILDERIQ